MLNWAAKRGTEKTVLETKIVPVAPSSSSSPDKKISFDFPQTPDRKAVVQGC